MQINRNQFREEFSDRRTQNDHRNDDVFYYKWRSARRIIEYLIFIIAVVGTWVVYREANFYSQHKNTIYQEKTDSLKIDNIYSMYDINKPFSKERLVDIVSDLSIKHPKIVIAQAILETGHFTSQLFILNHNLFGMRVAYKRPSTHADNSIRDNYVKGYAFYTTWENSVIDYALWQGSYARNLNEEQYFEKLQSVYAEDPNYVKRLKQIIIDNKEL